MKNLVSRCRIRFLWWLLRWQHLSNSAAAAEETVACDVVFSVFWRVFGLPQVARKFGEQFFFREIVCQIKTSYENFQNARRKYPQRPFLGHRPLFQGPPFGRHGRFSLGSWSFHESRLVKANRCRWIRWSLCREAQSDCRWNHPAISVVPWPGLEHLWRGWQEARNSGYPLVN